MSVDSTTASASPAVHRRGVVAVMVRGDCLLVIRRSQHVVAPGAYCFPGGGIEGDETEEAALRRELVEELNVQVTPVRRLWESVTPWGVALGWWLVELAEHDEPNPSPQEVESVHWLSPTDMAALVELLVSNRHFLAAWKQGCFQLPITLPTD